MRRSMMVVAALLVAATACSSGSGRVENHPDAIALPTAAAGDPWNLSVLVVNNARASHVITVDLDGKRAVDAGIPAAAPNNPTIVEYRYTLGAGEHRLVALSGDKRSTLTVPVKRSQPVWVVIQDYDSADLGLESRVYPERPGFG